MERKVRRNLAHVDPIAREVREESLEHCLRIFRNEYTIKGGCDNVSLERITSLIIRE